MRQRFKELPSFEDRVTAFAKQPKLRKTKC
jgi:hypothetical protein